jgi:hypothetical protein
MKLRPPVRATLPSLVLESRLRRIPPSAVSRLAALAERQSEGRFERTPTARTYFGATYFCFPLSAVRAAFAGRTVREMSLGDLAGALADHPLLRLRLLRIAREEAERRIAGGAAPRGTDGATMAPGTARFTSAVTTDERAVMIEVGVEVPCAACRGSSARHGGRAERSD